MKKTLLTLMLGGAIMASAETTSVDFSYIDAIETYLGTQKKETYDVAVFLPGNVFEGFTLTEISGQLNGAKGSDSYKNLSVWLTTELKLTNKVNDANVATYTASIDDESLFKSTLDEPYTITADGIYVGYSFTVDKLNSASKFPVAVANCSDPNSFFIHTSRGGADWENMATAKGFGCALNVVVQSDNMPARSVVVALVDNPMCIKAGEVNAVPLTLSSTSSEAVSSVDLDYTINGKDYTAKFDLPNPVQPGLNKKFEVSLEIPAIDETVRTQGTFKVAKVNGESNEASNPEANVDVVVLEDLPVHQTLFEEYTGTWCGWCTRGYAALEYIKKNHPDFVVAAFHNSDAMAITNSYPTQVSGFPSAVLNRDIICDPYYGTQQYDSKIPIVDDILALNAEFTPWVIKVSHNWDSNDLLTAKAEVTNVGGIENANCKMVYLLVADGLSGTTSQWNQTNNYSSSSPSNEIIDELNQFCRGGEYGQGTVKGLIFDDVVVSTTGINGIKGSLPESFEPGVAVEHTITYDLSTIKSSLIPDKNKLRVIAAVVDINGSVLNCAKNEINDYIGSDVPDAVDVVDSANAPVEYFNLNGVKVSNPHNGVFIRKQGNTTSKVILK